MFSVCSETDFLSMKRRYKKGSVFASNVESYGSDQYPWRPPTAIRERRAQEIEGARHPKSWAQFFREYRAYAECVLDYFRAQG